MNFPADTIALSVSAMSSESSAVTEASAALHTRPRAGQIEGREHPRCTLNTYVSARPYRNIIYHANSHRRALSEASLWENTSSDPGEDTADLSFDQL